MGLTPVPRLEHYKDFYFAQFRSRRGRSRTPISPAPRTTSISSSTSRRPARWRSSPARRNTTSRRTGSCWSRTASTTITSSPRIRPGSTTCATPASTSRRPRATCCRPRASARISATAISPPTIRTIAAARWRAGFRSTARRPRPTSTRSATSWSRGSARRAPRASPTPTAISCIFPNLVINDGSSVTVRHFYPVAPDLMHVTAWALGPVEETEAQRARRLHAFLTFYGPGGFATPDDVAALELAQQGYAAWREVPWTDLSRGMGNEPTSSSPPTRAICACSGGKWNELMEQRGMNKPLDPAATVTRAEVEDLLYHEADLLDTWQLDDWLGAADRRRRLLRAAERQAGRRSPLHAVHHRRRHRAAARAHHPAEGPELPRRVSAVAHAAADHQRAHHRRRGRHHLGRRRTSRSSATAATSRRRASSSAAIATSSSAPTPA